MTQACWPIRRPSLSGLWCWATSTGLAQKAPTGSDLSVAMETVSPAKSPSMSPCTCFWDCLSLLYSPNLTHQTFKELLYQLNYKIICVLSRLMIKTFSFILQKMSGTLHFLTKRRRTSIFPHSTGSWARTSPSSLKPLHPPVFSWKTWASKTLFGLNSAVSKKSIRFDV